MINEDIKEELQHSTDGDVNSIIGYCIALLDCRKDEEIRKETTFKIEPCTSSEFHGISCLENDSQYGFFKSDVDVRPGHATWIDKDRAERLYQLFRQGEN